MSDIHIRCSYCDKLLRPLDRARLEKGKLLKRTCSCHRTMQFRYRPIFTLSERRCWSEREYEDTWSEHIEKDSDKEFKFGPEMEIWTCGY